MKKLKNIPSPILRRIIGPPIVAFGFLLVGIAVYIYNRDKLVLVMSSLIAAWGAGSCIGTYMLAVAEEYKETLCICTKIQSRFFGRRFEIELVDAQGNAIFILQQKRHGFRLGQWYKVFLEKEIPQTSGANVLAAFIGGATLLGYEDAEAPQEEQEE